MFKVLSTGTNICPQSWPNTDQWPCRRRSAWIQPKTATFLQGSVATLLRWSWKILSYFLTNLSKTLHINFYQNRSSIVEVMIKKFWCVFYASQCTMHVCGLLCAQALTAEVNMQSTQLQEHKSDVLRLRNEITEWKQKYYDCRRKVVAQTQYVRSSLPHFAFVTYAVGD